MSYKSKMIDLFHPLICSMYCYETSWKNQQLFVNKHEAFSPPTDKGIRNDFIPILDELTIFTKQTCFCCDIIAS